MSGLFEATVRNTALFLEYRVFYPVLSQLPISIAYKIATAKGMLACFFCQNSIDACILGLQQCLDLSTDEYKKIAQAQLRMLAREKMDVYYLPRMNKENLDNYIKLRGLENYLNAQKTAKPIILYTAHFGRSIMPPVALGLLGFETSAYTVPVHGTGHEGWYLKKKIKAIQNIIKGGFIHTDQSTRSLYKTLAEGKTLVVAVDVPPQTNQAYYEAVFLKGKIRLPKGIVKLAKKMDALLVPYFALEHEGFLSAEFMPAIATRGVKEQDIFQLILKPIEAKILKYPDHWWAWSWLASFWQPEQLNA